MKTTKIVTREREQNIICSVADHARNINLILPYSYLYLQEAEYNNPTTYYHVIILSQQVWLKLSQTETQVSQVHLRFRETVRFLRLILKCK